MFWIYHSSFSTSKNIKRRETNQNFIPETSKLQLKSRQDLFNCLCCCFLWSCLLLSYYLLPTFVSYVGFVSFFTSLLLLPESSCCLLLAHIHPISSLSSPICCQQEKLSPYLSYNVHALFVQMNVYCLLLLGNDKCRNIKLSILTLRCMWCAYINL